MHIIYKCLFNHTLTVNIVKRTDHFSCCVKVFKTNTNETDESDSIYLLLIHQLNKYSIGHEK